MRREGVGGERERPPWVLNMVGVWGGWGEKTGGVVAERDLCGF